MLEKYWGQIYTSKKIVGSLGHGDPGKTTFTDLAHVGLSCGDCLFAVANAFTINTPTTYSDINLPKL